MNLKKTLLVSILSMVFVVAFGAINAKAASTDKNSPTVLSYTGYSGGHASAYLKGDSEKDHYYRFTMNNTSYYSDLTAVILSVPSGCDYQMEIEGTDGSYYQGAYSASSNNKIIKIDKPQNITSYDIHIFTFDEVYTSSDMYEITIDKAYVTTGSYTGNFSPSTITNPGGATLTPVSSTMTSINLSNISSIPNSAQVTSVQVSGTLSRNIGNTRMRLTNMSSGITQEGILSKGSNTNFAGYNNSYDDVKTIWTMDYYTYAGYSTTFKNAKIIIKYRYDKYENF